MDLNLFQRRYPLFAALDRPTLESWRAAGVPRSLAMGETLFHAGTPGNHAYLVLAGRMHVSRLAKEGREIALGVFGPGELFGEYALLPPGLNTATCRAASAGEVLQLPLAPIRQALACQPQVREHLKRWLRLHAVLGHLRDRTALGFMSAPSLLALLDRFQTGQYPAGRTIQADGLSADCWFVILKGQVRVVSVGEDALPSPILLGPGESFGETALLDRPGLPLAEAVTDAQCMSLRREAFYEVKGTATSASIQTLMSQRLDPPCFPWVGQRETSDCGLAALAMVARFHGLPVTLERLREHVTPSQRGMSLRDLQEAAHAWGFRSQAVRIGLEQLSNVKWPAIAHLLGEHYVVVYGLDSAGFTVGDPSLGVLVKSGKEFLSSWSGNLLLLTASSSSGGIALVGRGD